MSFLLKRKPILNIAITILSGISVIAILLSLSYKPPKSNGFKRTFLSKDLTLENSFEHDGTVTGISGYSTNLIYFQTMNPSDILTLNMKLRYPQYKNLNIPANKILNSNFKTFVDSPLVYILGCNLPSIIFSNIDTLHNISSKFPSSYFTRGVALPNGAFILRAYDTSVKTRDQIFVKGWPLKKILQREQNISEKHGDGGISTDGLLYYDNKTNLIIYMFFYKNGFICLDTNLNRKYLGKTVDTLSELQMESGMAIFNNNKIATSLSPSRNVNLQACAENGKLYINSGLKADNEETDQFSKNSVIDIYNIETGAYEGSYYIPYYKGKRLLRFKVIGKTIVVLYRNGIVKYSTSFL